MIEAMKQALEALDGLSEPYYVLKAQDALRAALAQPEQEPVAWMYHGIRFDDTPHDRPSLIWRPEYMDAMSASKGVVASPLYDHPPRRDWQGLTDEEIGSVYVKWDETPGVSMADLARAVEAALKERNA